MYKLKLLTSICMILLINTNPVIAADEFSFHYSADLRTNTTFQWRVDNFIFNYFTDNVAVDPTNLLVSEEVYQSGIIYFPDASGVPAETNGSIYQLTVNEDIDLVESFDQIILSFDYIVTLDNTAILQTIDGLDISKPLFNFFNLPSEVVYENETRLDYFDFISKGSSSYEESLTNNYNRLGFYPSRISELASFVDNGLYVEIEKTADCIADGVQSQTCDGLDSFIEYQTVARYYDTTSGKLLKYDYSENRTFDSNDRLYPSVVIYNLTNIDPTSGSGPEIPDIAIDEDSLLDIPQSAIIISAIIVGVFVVILGIVRLNKKGI